MLHDRFDDRRLTHDNKGSVWTGVLYLGIGKFRDDMIDGGFAGSGALLIMFIAFTATEPEPLLHRKWSGLRFWSWVGGRDRQRDKAASCRGWQD